VSEPEDLVRIIADEGVHDPRLLEALRSVPRAGFVPADLAGQAYEDKPLPIPHEQVTTQPSLVARMVEALGLAGSERVLVVGAGLRLADGAARPPLRLRVGGGALRGCGGGSEEKPGPVQRNERRGGHGRRDEGST
jgi:Protein-L-isoaspartate(D-aspartate) O-methyltransferase (PCMT)